MIDLSPREFRELYVESKNDPDDLEYAAWVAENMARERLSMTGYSRSWYNVAKAAREKAASLREKQGGKDEIDNERLTQRRW